MVLDAEIAVLPALDADLEVSRVVMIADNPYPGPYAVTPLVWNAVTLATAQKTMTGDVTVYKIPQYETDNVFGGKTLVIGDDYQ